MASSSSNTTTSNISPPPIPKRANSLWSPNSSLSPPPAARSGRPMLTRLDTSERVKTNSAKNNNENQTKTLQDHTNDGDLKKSSNVGSSSQARRLQKDRSDPGTSRQHGPRLKLDTSSGSNSSGGSSSVSSTSSSWQRNSPPYDSTAQTLGWAPANPTRNGIVASELIHGTSRLNKDLAAQTLPHRRRDSERAHDSGSLSAVPKSIRSPISPTRSFSLSSGATLSASFEPSEILSNFLYLGPEITTLSEVDYLRKRLGIRRILNAAYEIEDGGGKHLNLNHEEKSGFERYKKLPLKDIVEAKGVQKYIEEACTFLDDARLHSAPTYVHCKAGKSRSVMLVMAYLIHSNRWTLQRSYSYVVDRRHDVSPNIGFVAELMAFEEKRLGSSKRGNTLRSNHAQADAEDGNSEGPNDVMAVKSESSSMEKSEVSMADRRRAAHESMPATPKSTIIGDNLDKSEENLNPNEDHVEQTASPDMMSDPTVPWFNEKGGDSTFNLNGVSISNEYRGEDGRYHIVRPPADEKFLAPGRRATLAAVDSENFSRTIQNVSLEDNAESSLLTEISSVTISSSKHKDTNHVKGGHKLYNCCAEP